MPHQYNSFSGLVYVFTRNQEIGEVHHWMIRDCSHQGDRWRFSALVSLPIIVEDATLVAVAMSGLLQQHWQSVHFPAMATLPAPHEG